MRDTFVFGSACWFVPPEALHLIKWVTLGLVPRRGIVCVCKLGGRVRLLFFSSFLPPHAPRALLTGTQGVRTSDPLSPIFFPSGCPPRQPIDRRSSPVESLRASCDARPFQSSLLSRLRTVRVVGVPSRAPLLEMERCNGWSIGESRMVLIAMMMATYNRSQVFRI